VAIPPPADAPVSGRDPRRLPVKPKVVAPRLPLAPPPANAPIVNPPAPVASQSQLAPLPPPIDVRPAPGVLKQRPRPPLSLTPQVANPPPRPALQNSN
jgi:large subunit ribosomal protein L24